MGSNKRSLEAKLHTTRMVPHFSTTQQQSSRNNVDTKCRKKWTWSFLKDRERDYGHFKIKQKLSSNLLPNFIDSKGSDYLDYVFSKDIAWAIGNKYISSDKDSLEPIGSQTTLMKSVLSVKTHKAILKYLEVVSLTPGDNVCKW